MSAQLLSVIIPVYNECRTIETILGVIERVPVEKEMIVVDDGSTDGTREILSQKFKNRPGTQIIFHDSNRGKGEAVRTGVAKATGERVIIQDADLEYDPSDYLKLLAVAARLDAPVVYGSRFLGNKKASSRWHRTVNGFLTQLTNFLYGSRLTDMETCYKLIHRDVIKKILLISKGFEIEVELTAKILKAGFPIVEVPIAYKGRSFHEGKKIGWRDGVMAVERLFYFRFHP